jgi:polyisoprenoid-binding protein YceI
MIDVTESKKGWLVALCSAGVIAAGIVSLRVNAAEQKKDAAPSAPGVFTSYDPEGGFKAGLNFADAPAGEYRLDPQHSHLIFQMAHYGGLSRPVMRFTNVSAEYDWNPAKPEETRVEARIAVSSFVGGDRDFEIRMQAPDVLRGWDSDEGGGKYRYIVFESTDIKFTGKTPDGRHKGTMKGDLTMFGVTQPVTLDLTYNGFIQNRLGYRKMGFSATGSLDRSLFGMKSVPSAGKQVDVTMELEFMHATRGKDLRNQP